jgi:hypothetical protein
MNILENAMEVAAYYATEKTKIGTLNFDEKEQRFYIKTNGRRKAEICPDNFIHGGDIYILQDSEGKWRICQCDKTAEDKFRFMGSDVTQDNVNNNKILYVKKNRLAGCEKKILCDDVHLKDLSDEIIATLLNSSK